MRHILTLAGALTVTAVFTASFFVAGVRAEETAKAVIPAEHEEFKQIPLPAGFQIQYSELDGPVLANMQGKTLYYWPHTTLRNGVTGDTKNQSACTYEKTTHTAGLMSPYPPGLELPELDTRMSCAEVWSPEYAADDAKPVGDFTILTRKDNNRKQWAYDGHALYSSYLDKVPGDVMAATTGRYGVDGPAARDVATAPSEIPPGFAIASTLLGRQLLTDKNFSVYMFDGDGPNKSNCDANCTADWAPVLAPASARALGDWTVFERSPGVRQWAYRKKPLYTYALDADVESLQGSDIPRWHNVYTQKAPPPPSAFTFQDSITGVVLADSQGRTIYTYNCADDSVDQLACDQVDSPAAYRLAICGGGQVDRCLRDWPYVVASADEHSISRTWQVISINPRTGHLAEAGDADAIRVWAYKGQPIYTNAHDTLPGGLYGHGNGEFIGSRNGFRAFIVRDVFAR